VSKVFAAVVARVKEDESVALVGHDPQMSLLVAALALLDHADATRVDFRKGAIVRIDVDALPPGQERAALEPQAAVARDRGRAPAGESYCGPTIQGAPIGFAVRVALHEHQPAVGGLQHRSESPFASRAAEPTPRPSGPARVAESCWYSWLCAVRIIAYLCCCSTLSISGTPGRVPWTGWWRATMVYVARASASVSVSRSHAAWVAFHESSAITTNRASPSDVCTSLA